MKMNNALLVTALLGGFAASTTASACWLTRALQARSAAKSCGSYSCLPSSCGEDVGYSVPQAPIQRPSPAPAPAPQPAVDLSTPMPSAKFVPGQKNRVPFEIRDGRVFVSANSF